MQPEWYFQTVLQMLKQCEEAHEYTTPSNQEGRNVDLFLTAAGAFSANLGQTDC